MFINMIHFQVEAVAEGSAADSVSCYGVPDDPPCAWYHRYKSAQINIKGIFS